MNPAVLLQVLNGIKLATQVIDLATQAGAAFNDLKKDWDYLHQLVVDKKPLTPEQHEQLMSRHAELFTAAMRPIGDLPEGAQ